MEKFKAVFHIDNPEKWNILLANVGNLVKDLGRENVTVEVVANGPAVSEYVHDSSKDNSCSKILNRILEASKLDVDFGACRNAITVNKINEELIPSFIRIVPAGVTELVRRQAEGYSYIKP